MVTCQIRTRNWVCQIPINKFYSYQQQKHMGILKSISENPKNPSSPISYCEQIPQLDTNFAHCFSTLLRGGKRKKQEIIQVAVFPVISIPDCLKIMKNFKCDIFSWSFRIILKTCNYTLRHYDVSKSLQILKLK